MIKLDFDGYSVGGLAVDHETRDMWKIVKLMGEILPENKQRYLMGVGTPDDIIKATKLGMDMFDCVLPTRLARHGVVFVKHDNRLSTIDYRQLNLLNSKFRADGGVIDPKCGCLACRASDIKLYSSGEIPIEDKVEYRDSRGLSRAYISHLIRSKEILGIHLTSLHNLWVYIDLMKSLRK